MLKILTISPGSTSTKLAVFEDDKRVFKVNVMHDTAMLKQFSSISDQLPYRKQTIFDELEKAGFRLVDMDAFSAFSGGLESLEGGVYSVNDVMLAHSRLGRTVKHPAILGAQLIDLFRTETGKPAFVVNPPDVDEFEPIARVTGIKGLYRESRVHALNQKEVAMRYAGGIGKTYETCNVVVAHVGGGLSVCAHQNGRMIDGNDVLNGDGPMAPNRSGSVPAVPIIKMCYSGEFAEQDMIAKIGKTGGLMSHLNTDNTMEISKRISEGDDYAKLIYDAMAYQLAKAIGAYSVVLRGKVDGILLTGGVSNDTDFVSRVSDLVGWIAPVKAYGGDFEMEALAAGAIRALHGTERVKTYTGIPVFNGFNINDPIEP